MMFIEDISGRYLINVNKIVSLEYCDINDGEWVVCTVNNEYFHITKETLKKLKEYHDTVNPDRIVSQYWRR